MARFELPSLAADDPIDVGGQIVWGPFATGSGFVFSTDVGEIVYMQGDGKITWKTTLGDRLTSRSSRRSRSQPAHCVATSWCLKTESCRWPGTS